MPPYSPWADAAQGLTGGLNTVSQLPIRLAMLKEQQQQRAAEEAYKQQQINIALQQMNANVAMDKEHENLYRAQAQRQNDINTTADIGGIAARARVPIANIPTLGTGNTLEESGMQLNGLADLMQALTRNKMLQGGIDPFATTQVGQNSTSFNRVTGEPMAYGPMNIPQGNEYQRTPGIGEIVTNVKPYMHNVPQGNVAVDATGKQVFNNPGVPGNQMNGLGSLLNYLSTASKPNDMGETPLMQTGTYTNALDLANVLMQNLRNNGANSPTNSVSKTTPTANTSSKVRVKGPNGETGTVPAGTKLPTGWSFE